MAAAFGKREYNTVSYDKRSDSNSKLQAETSASSADIGNLLSNVGSWLFSFNGRATRLEWWCFSFLTFFVVFPVLSGVIYAGSSGNLQNVSGTSLVIGFIIVIPWFLASIAVAVRRYHDIGKSGWWYLVGFVPCIGTIWQFVDLGFWPSNEGANQYG